MMNDRKLFLDIDVAKLRAAIKECKINGGKRIYSKDSTWYGWIDRMSLLCSIRAHSRGKIHATRKWNPVLGSAGEIRCDTRTLENQAALIGDLWLEFKYQKPAEVEQQMSQ